MCGCSSIALQLLGDGLQLHVKTLFDQPYIGGGQAVIVTLFVTKLERWPGYIDTQA